MAGLLPAAKNRSSPINSNSIFNDILGQRKGQSLSRTIIENMLNIINAIPIPAKVVFNIQSVQQLNAISCLNLHI